MTKKKSTIKGNIKKNIDESQSCLTLDAAIEKLQEICNGDKKRKFNESVDLVIKLGIDAKQTDQSVKGSILLPNGSGKKVRVAVFTDNEEQKKIALDNGAEVASLDDLVEKINEGEIGFDCYIATPEVMPKISKVSRKLGPRGLMPSPKNGTVTTDIKKAVLEAIKGKVNFKNDKSGIIHCLAGKVDFSKEDLVENINTIVKAVKTSRPENSKGKFITAIYVNSTMGPSISVTKDSL